MRNVEDFLTVSELNNYIRDVLNSGFPQAIWICGEVQELRDKKHLYFTLSEKDSDSNSIIAKIGVTIWANTRPRIDAILQKSENAFVFKDDIEVKLLCKVDFYAPFGQIRLVAESIDPTYTLGKIAQDRQRLIALLKQKGILEKNKILQLPILPLSIGLITSHGSAAYHDFMDELQKSGFAFSVKVIDSIMQGKTTEISVSKAVQQLNRIEGIDVIVITRGGGSITELSCFDSQIIAEAIAASRIPVISGIGHEINTTITDLAAHTFAKTPTATAALLISLIQKFWQNLEEKKRYVLESVQQKLRDQRQYVRHQAVTLRHRTTETVHSQHHRINNILGTFKQLPLSMLKEARRQSLQRKEDLKRTIQLRLSTSKTKIQTYQKLIDVVDPKNMLKKGFIITRDLKGKIIKSTKNLKVNSALKIQFSDGMVISDIKEINKGVYEL